MLHLVTGSPNQGTALAQASAAAAAGDDLVLMHAAVLAVRGATGFPPGVRIHAMAADLAARGIDPGAAAPGIAALDDAGLVALALRHAQCLTWS